MIISNDTSQVKQRLKLDEYNHVEKPFMEQLKGLGWQTLYLELHHQQPEQSQRSSFAEVIIRPELVKSLKKINSFLTDSQTDEVIRKLSSYPNQSLLECNQHVLNLLLENATVSRNEQTGERSPTVRFIDFKNLENNSFLAVSQFKLRIPGTENHIVPDITLFINGMPLVVVECKSPRVKEPIADALDQLMRYSEQRHCLNEGNHEFFSYNQFLIATCRNQAKFGTITTHIEKHFYRWTDPYPKTVQDLDHESSSPNDQQRLVAGMLSHKNLLELIQSFTIYNTTEEGDTIKVVARYQQYRAVKKCVEKLLAGTNRLERSGIIWHTQGSGKSLSMMFLVRYMKQFIQLAPWKIVFVTDRTQLQDQLNTTSQTIGYTVKLANSISTLKELIALQTPDLVMAMVQKFQERDLDAIFPELNRSPNILLMIDEAHRSIYKKLGANLDRAMPNSTRFAFTGTPTDRTEQTFKDYIDKYTMKQSNEDGVTLEIVYEGRTNNAEVEDQKAMDLMFEDVFSDFNMIERLQILGYGSRLAYLEAEDIIKQKASDIVSHYLRHIFPSGFKAQVVAASKEAAYRYKNLIDDALRKAIVKLKTSNPQGLGVDTLEKLETAIVISSDHNDKSYIKPFTNKSYHEKAVKRFKLPFNAKTIDGQLDGNIGIVIVHNMLITGFDAPIEQVLYLDRVIRSHHLLQTIARVNRVADEHKDKGFIIDYVGVGHHLKRALDDYEEREKSEILDCLKDDSELLSQLKQAHRDIFQLLDQHGCSDFSDPDAFYDLFYDEDIRFEYILVYKKFVKALNNVYPMKEALDYEQDFMNLTEINVLAERHLRDSRLSLKGIPDKLRPIVDRFLQSKGIEVKVKPISIVSDHFLEDVKRRKSKKTQAAEIEHAIRHYIELNIDEDPELFASFAGMLEQVLQDFKENWELIYRELERLREKIRNQEKENTFGLDRKKQMPFFRVFRKELFGQAQLTEDDTSNLVNLTQNLTNLISTELALVNFWQSLPAQNRLKGEIQQLLLSPSNICLPNMAAKRKEVISRIMEIARANHNRLVEDTWN